mmetsp:Transcript_2398/g.3842  ORF Transcript_2398/g.3842 Transcript_2398/m.3842 type:complete len:518 (+) Transcript_2398:178-1731(+)
MADGIYRIKQVSHQGNKVPILMQNENGPCPLLAISNILLLQKKLRIHTDLAYIDFGQLIQVVGDYLVEMNPPHPNPAMQANQQQQIADALAVLPKLGRGLDVNVRFQKISDFEYTHEMSVLDMLGINLTHGWLYDPQDTRSKEAIGDLSYNQLICQLVDVDATSNRPQEAAESKEEGEQDTRKHAEQSQFLEWAAKPSVVSWNSSVWVPKASARKEDAKPSAPQPGDNPTEDEAFVRKVKNAQVVEDFLQETASQLTYYGLGQLYAGVKEKELCVFFRNNHFCSLCKHKGELFLLVTDVGYYEEENIVWEKLADVTGDNAFCDGNFRVYHPTSSGRRESSAPKPASAVTLQDVQQALSNVAAAPAVVTGHVVEAVGEAVNNAVSGGATQPATDAVPTGKPVAKSQEQEDADLALALSLQAEFEEEERRRQQEVQAQNQAPAVAPHRPAQSGGQAAAPRPSTAGGGSAASRQSAANQGGVAQDQMALYRLAQQQRYQLRSVSFHSRIRCSCSSRVELL